MAPLLDQLNDAQRQAAEHVRGPLLVLAPVGTGKTTVLAHRAAHAIRTGVGVGRLLCLSFTNRAAREMRERLLALLGAAAGEVTVRTFHGFCAQVLRHEADALGMPADFSICDEEDVRDLLTDLALRQGLVQERATPLLTRALNRFVERMKMAPVTGVERPDPESLLSAIAGEVEPDVGSDLLRLDPGRLFDDYAAGLAASGALDFHDLIVRADRLFREREDRLRVWQQLFPWVQVDEVQDTNLAEYQVLSRLAWESHDLAFFGDIDQTIYEWRGSQPFATLREFMRRFHPVTKVQLTRNYRCGRDLLRASLAFIQALPKAVTKGLEADSVETGQKVCVHAAPTPEEEGRWIAETIDDLVRQEGLSRRRIAVLVRTNQTAASLSAVLQREKVECFLIDKLRFFVQPEVKDVLAAVRLLLNPLDGPSLTRVLRQRHLGVGRHIVEAVRSLPSEVGLRLLDLVDPDRGDQLDPFGPLLKAFDEGRVVVFDTETTGLNLARDDVVELAALKVGRLGPGAELHALLHTDRPLDESARVHGITAEVLASRGRPPAEVFAEFVRFVDGCVLVGHNVAYDVGIVRSQLARLGLPWPRVRAFDTLELTRRFFALHRYTLSYIAEALGLSSTPTHRAMDDVRTTWQLLLRLVPYLLRGRERRQRAVAQHAIAFAPLADQLRDWRGLLERERPIFLLNRVMDDARLREYWRAQNHGARREGNLHELARLFSEYDDGTLPPREALLHLLHLAALGSDVDRHVDADDKVFLLTVHQAKGLEFDAVFLAGATDREFPSYYSVREGRLAEEHRLFYVAMTRARRRLFISYPQRDDRGRSQKPTRFLDSLPTVLTEDV